MLQANNPRTRRRPDQIEAAVDADVEHSDVVVTTGVQRLDVDRAAEIAPAAVAVAAPTEICRAKFAPA